MDRVTEHNYQNLNPALKHISESVATKVALRRNEGYGYDILTIISVANCVVKTLMWLYKCYYGNSKKALKKMQDPGFFDRMIIKRQIRKEVGKEKVDDVYYAMTKYAQDSMTRQDVEHILNIKKYGQVFKGN